MPCLLACLFACLMLWCDLLPKIIVSPLPPSLPSLPPSPPSLSRKETCRRSSYSIKRSPKRKNTPSCTDRFSTFLPTFPSQTTPPSVASPLPWATPCCKVHPSCRSLPLGGVWHSSTSAPQTLLSRRAEWQTSSCHQRRPQPAQTHRASALPLASVPS